MSSVTDSNKKALIKNFTGSQSLEVERGNSFPEREIPEVVRLINEGGSMRFQFTMTPNQARELADALTTFANEIDGGAA